ncbi:MAG: hypothetical protein ACM3X5_03940, partial [Bacillota bacterium]
MAGNAQSDDFAAQRARMVAEVDAMYAETRSETGLAAMSPAVRAAMAKVERHRLVPPGERASAYQNRARAQGPGAKKNKTQNLPRSTGFIFF